VNPQLLLVLGLLGGCIALFIANKPRMDIVALLAMVALPLCGVVTVPEALAGAATPSTSADASSNAMRDLVDTVLPPSLTGGLMGVRVTNRSGLAVGRRECSRCCAKASRRFRAAPMSARGGVRQAASSASIR